MANYTPANLKVAQAKLIAAYQASELRFRDPVTFKEFIRQSPIMLPNYDQLRTREDRVVETNYRLRTSRALGTGGRTHNHTGVKGDSDTFTPAWTPYDDTFSISLKQADNNIYSLDEMLNNEFQNSVGNFAEGFETAAVTHLFNNRSGVNIATQEGTFDATDDAFQIAAADEQRLIQITKTTMEVNKYSSRLTVFCDTVAWNKFNFQANQGQANSTNLEFQFGGIKFVHSIELGALAAGLVGAYTDGFWIAVPEGTISALPWIPKQNRQGIDTKIQTYGNLFNPVDGLTYAMHTYPVAEDGTATNGYAQDELTQYELSLDVALNNAPLSTASETTLQAFAVV